ncbi:hypothetical protein N7456_009882 [Penicillium angulare]|uniref:DUF7136 domain-containing protein n=1 Tax=Penicillium angulare TaxID=116970 RepID=A0A9W9K657_9EURO|nr:hypothetical protein N7456_009882 [Penicillium angulare]
MRLPAQLYDKVHTILLIVGFVVSTSLAASQAIELDLVFPRNDTYAPLAFFPIVLAVQNANLAWQLGAAIQYSLYYLDSDDILKGNAYVSSGSPSTDPFFWIDYTQRTDQTEGAWLLYWEFGLYWNCSYVNGSYSAEQSYESPGGMMYFTTASDGKQPDFESETCPMPIAIEVKEVYERKRLRSNLGFCTESGNAMRCAVRGFRSKQYHQ